MSCKQCELLLEENRAMKLKIFKQMSLNKASANIILKQSVIIEKLQEDAQSEVKYCGMLEDELKQIEDTPTEKININ